MTLYLYLFRSPDTIVMNSADGDGYLKINGDYSYVPVYYNGDVYFPSSLIALKTRCALNMAAYPVIELRKILYNKMNVLITKIFYF